MSNPIIRVLAVDDEDELGLITKIYLEKSGDIWVEVAKSVSEAWKCMDRIDFDIIISDYQMPDEDGIQFLKTIRNRGNKIPFILFTGKGREEVVIEALNNGADFYIQKGANLKVHYKELENSIRHAVSRRRGEVSLLESLKELREATVRYQALISSSNTGAWEYNTGTGYAWCSPEYFTMLGRDINEFDISGKRNIEKVWMELLHPDDRDIAIKNFQDYLDSGEGLYEQTFRLSNKDGSWAWVLSRCKKLSDADGRPTGIVAGTHIDITRNRNAEDSLKANQHMLTKILETSPNLVYIYDLKEHRNLYANREVVDFLGYSPEQLIEMGSRLFELILHPDDVEYVGKYQNGVRDLKDGEISEGEYRMLRADGSWCWLRSRDLVFSRDPDGSVRSELGVAEDVTEKKKAEDDLRLSEERLREAIETTPAGYFLIDRDGRFQKVNEAWLKMHGYESADEVIGQHLSLTQPPEFQKTANDIVTSLFEEGPIISAEAPRLCKDGSIKYHSFSAHTVVKDGKVTGLEGFLIDSTDRIRLEKAAKNNHMQLLAVIDAATSPTYVADPVTYEILHVNQAMSNVFGSPDGKKCYEYLQNRTAPCPFCSNDRIFGPNIGKTYVWSFQNEINRSWYQCIDRAITWPDGRSVRYEMAIDITEFKRIEEALRIANAKMSLLSQITRHDILNQMTVLKGHLGLMDQEGIPAGDIKHLKMAMEAADRITGMIDFTKVYENIGVIDPEWTSLSHHFHRAFKALHPSGMKLEDESGGYEILADPLVEKVAFNLIDNSIRHGVHVKTIKISADQEGEGLLIAYQDDGVGISQKEREHLFQKGYGKNTGIGLFLSREMLAITGITISENGSTEKGARFEIRVPAGAWRRIA